MDPGSKEKFVKGYIGFIRGAAPVNLLAFLLISLLVLWQMAPSPHYPVYVTKGWNKLQPLTQTIIYRTNGSYSTVFVNVLGTTMRVNHVVVGDTITGATCDDINVNSVYFDSGMGNVTAKAGDTFQIKARCPEKHADDPYDFSIVIDYTAVLGGVTSHHNENGHIQGPVER
jgi:hypothetical protein